MSDDTRRLSDAYLRRIELVEEHDGPRRAADVAEAHVDAGARYLEGERVPAPSELLTATMIQNQI